VKVVKADRPVAEVQAEIREIVNAVLIRRSKARAARKAGATGR
jgi:hypothetical protein